MFRPRSAAHLLYGIAWVFSPWAAASTSAFLAHVPIGLDKYPETLLEVFQDSSNIQAADSPTRHDRQCPTPVIARTSTFTAISLTRWRGCEPSGATAYSPIWSASPGAFLMPCGIRRR